MLASLVARARFEIGTWRRTVRAAFVLRRAAGRARSTEQALDAAWLNFGLFSIRPVQVRSEIAALLELLTRDRPRRVLEVGTASGGTLYLFAWASEPGARLLSLDIRTFESARRHLYRSCMPARRTVQVWRADSHLPETRAAVERYFGGQQLDLVFIDGDHSYESVRRDYELYGSLVRPGGFVAFHDIVDGPEEAVGGVPRFWR